MNPVYRGVKAIFFDYGGTLDACGVAWKEHFWPIYVKHCRKSGLQINYPDFVGAFYRSDDSLVDEGNPDLNLSMIVHEQVRRVFANLGLADTGLVDAISADFLASSLKSINRALPILKELKRNFLLGIISNNYGNLESICIETGLAELMDVMVDSRVVGAVKPDPHIFKTALEALGIEPAESVMVGDSFHRDIQGALAMGMKAVWMVPEKGRNDAESNVKNNIETSVPVISSVSELNKLLC